MFENAPFVVSGNEDRLWSDTAGFDFLNQGVRSSADVRLTMEYIERDVCSYSLVLNTIVKTAFEERVPIMIDIGFTSSFPDQGYMHNRHALLSALTQEEFLTELLRCAFRYSTANQSTQLNIFMRIVDAEIGKLCIKAGYGSGGSIGLVHTSKSFHLDVIMIRLAEGEAYLDKAFDKMRRQESIIECRKKVLLFMKGVLAIRASTTA